MLAVASCIMLTWATHRSTVCADSAEKRSWDGSANFGRKMQWQFHFWEPLHKVNMNLALLLRRCIRSNSPKPLVKYCRAWLHEE
eukprot:6455361-Amphidinium_carterae.1